MNEAPETVKAEDENSENSATDTGGKEAATSQTLDTFKKLGTFDTFTMRTPKPPQADTPKGAGPFPKGGIALGDAVLANVMEEVVLMEAPKVMNSFDMCLCEKCVFDVVALSLNLLPARYVVTERGTLLAKVIAYKDQYRVDVYAGLAQACNTVRKSPRHQ